MATCDGRPQTIRAAVDDPQRLSDLTSVRSRPVVELEPLEARLFLSGELDFPSSSGPQDRPPVSVCWFETLSDRPETVCSGESSPAGGADVIDMVWQGGSARARRGEWLVGFTSQATQGMTGVADAASLLAPGAPDFGVICGLGMAGQVLIRAPGADEASVAIWLGGNPNVEFFEPNRLLVVERTPDDPAYWRQWSLHQIGAEAAWDIATGNDSVVVAVVDTGIDYSHPDVEDNIWANPGEIPGNDLDDDMNGFVDDVCGWDFVYGDSAPTDLDGHGTHVAGIVGAKGDNGIGIAGVNWSCSLMALKAMNDQGWMGEADEIRAINYATLMRSDYGINVRVINASFGWYDNSAGSAGSAAERDAIQEAGAAGILFVASAGNDGLDTDDHPHHYPSGYLLDNIISVASSDDMDFLSTSSNYGHTSVDLAAPGEDIYSTVPGGGYEEKSGTSMAAPHVAGVAALLWTIAPTASYQEIRQAIFDGGDPVSWWETVTDGRLNAFKAINALGSRFQGACWNDLDGDGTRDSGEPGLGGRVVYLDLNNNGIFEAGGTVAIRDSRDVSLPKSISESITTTSSLRVSGLQGTIADIDVRVTITHTRDEDLDVYLISPGGVRVELFTDVGGTGDNFTNTIFDDEADTSIASGTAPFTGRYRPEGSLAALDGRDPNGTWKLELWDDTAGVTGFLWAWSIKVRTSATVEPSVVTDQNGQYGFAVDPGTYAVGQVLPGGGWVATAPLVRSVPVPPGGVVRDVDFGSVTVSRVAGSVWRDADADGARDLGEGLEGWRVYLDVDGDGEWDGDGGAASVSSIDVPKAIPDQGTVWSQLTVVGTAGVLLDVDVALTIQHGWDEDLDVYLISPGGVRVELFTDVGGSGVDFTGTILDDEAASSITSGSAPFPNRYRPEGSLSILDGASANGTWRLEVTDDEALLTGTLVSWSISIQTAGEPSALTAANGAYSLIAVSARVPTGVYALRQVTKADWQLTAPAGGSYSVLIYPGSVSTDRDFENRLPVAEIAILYGLTPLADGQAAPVVLGPVHKDKPSPTATFTVCNESDAATLTLGTLSIPGGYTVVKPPPPTLGPGASDTFVLALDTPNEGSFTGTVSLVSDDADGGDGVESPFEFPISGAVTLPPEIDPTDSALEYRENAGWVAVDAGLIVTGPAGAVLVGAVVGITDNYRPAEDALDFIDGDGITGSWSGPTGTLTLSGTATAAQYQAALRCVVYRNSSEAPSLLPRTVSFTAADALGSGGPAGRILNVVPENDAPVLDDQGSMALGAIDEDDTDNPGALVSALISSAGGDRITDVDAGALEGIAVIGADNANGAWQYSTDGGTQWLAFEAPSDTAACLLRPTDKVRLVPNSNWNGLAADGVTFRAWDQTSGTAGGTADASSNGGMTAFSTATETAGISVNPVNDKPVAHTQSGLATDEHVAKVITLTGSDVETPAGQLVFLLVTQALHGRVVISGDEATYTPTGHYNGPDSFTFRVTDTGDPPGGGASPALNSDPATVRVTVKPVNDRPTAYGQFGVTADETVAKVITLVGYDVETPAGQLSYAIVTPPTYGTVTLVGDKATYCAHVDHAVTDIFTFQVTDTGDPAGEGTSPPLSSSQAGVSILVSVQYTRVDAKKPFAFRDSDGELVTVKLTGSGWADVQTLNNRTGGEAAGDINRLILNGTKADSVLTITATPAYANKVARTAVGEVRVNGVLKSLAAKTTNLIGNLTVDGYLTSLTLGDVLGGTISIGPRPPGDTKTSVMIVAGQVCDATLDSKMPIQSLTAGRWLDTGDPAEAVTAPSLGTLSVAGDFQAKLVLNSGGSPAVTALKSVKIAGAATALWDVTGNVGSVTINGSVGAAGAPWELRSATSVGTLTLGDVTNANVTVSGALGAVKATRWLAGAIQATKAASIATTGLAKPLAIGDFGANVTLSGAGVTGTAKTLGSASIKGNVGASIWDLTGPVGTLAITGMVGTVAQPWRLIHPTSLGGLTLGDVTNAVVSITGDCGAIKAKRWQDGSIQAAKIASIAATGVAGTTTVQAVPGDFGADMTLTNALAKVALGTLTVAGWLDGSTISSAGALGTLTVGGLRSSTITAGDLGGTPATQMALGSLTVKGIAGETDLVLGSSISAWTLGTVTLRDVNPANGGTVFGVKGHTLASYT
ncbi:MAG: S8 family serine peptidase, partial [Planctomycetota bacterium]|nr:S8 family serine peptidase [Planctomycetota bacterium]